MLSKLDIRLALERQLEQCGSDILKLRGMRAGDAERISQLQQGISSSQVAYAALATALYQVVQSEA